MKLVRSALAALCVLTACAAGQERPPSDDPQQLFPRALPEIRVSRSAKQDKVAAKNFLYASLAVGDRGVTHLAWIEVVTLASGPVFKVLHAERNPLLRRFNGFSAPVELQTLAASGGAIGDSIGIVVDRAGDVYIVWAQSTTLPFGGSFSSVYFSRRKSGGWTTGVLRQGSLNASVNINYESPRIAIFRGPGADRVAVAWRKVTTTAAGAVTASIEASEDAAANVTVATVYTGSASSGDYPSEGPSAMTIEPGGNLYVAWRRFNASAAVAGWYVSRGERSSWRHQRSGAVIVQDMETDSTGRVHALIGNNGYRTLGPDGFSALETIDPTDAFWSLAVDSRNNPRTVGVAKGYFTRLGGAWRRRASIYSDGLSEEKKELAIDDDDTLVMAGWSAAATFSELIEHNLGAQDSMEPAGSAAVNPANGNLFRAVNLFTADGRVPQSLWLNYNSLGNDEALLPRGYRLNVQVVLTDTGPKAEVPIPQPPRRIRVQFGDGRSVVYLCQESKANCLPEEEYGESSEITIQGTEEAPTYKLQRKDGSTLEFNERGLLVRVQDQQATPNKTEFSYDTSNRVRRILDGSGRSTFLTYNDTSPDPRQRGRLSLVTDPCNYSSPLDCVLEVTEFRYDNLGNLTEANHKGVRWGFSYSARGRFLERIQTPRNFGSDSAHVYEYSPDHRVVKFTDTKQKTKTFDYREPEFTTVVIDRRDSTTVLVTMRRLSMVRLSVNSTGASVERTITPGRLVTEIKDGSGNVTTIAYASYETPSNPLPASCVAGTPGSAAGQRPPAWVKDNIESVRRPGTSAPVRMYHNFRSELVCIIDALQNTTTIAYDLTGVNAVVVRGPFAAGQAPAEIPTVTNAYDAFGRITASTNARGYTTAFTYGGGDGGSDKGTGLVTSVLHPGISVPDRYHYDMLGRAKEFVSGSGAVTKWRYGAGGRLDEVTLPITDGETAPVMGYEYYPFGLLHKQKGPRAGQETEHFYDSEGLVRQTRNALGQDTQFFYDGEDALEWVYRADGSWSRYSRDAVGRPQSEEHDAAPSPNLVTFFDDYDLNGRPQEIRGAGLPDGAQVRTRYEYDARDNVKKATYGNGVVDRMDYDDNDQLVRRVRNSSDGAFYSGVRYTYDASGRTKSVTELRSASSDQGITTAFRYDGNGNLERVTNALGQSTRYEYDAADRLAKEFDQDIVQQSQVEYNDAARTVELRRPNPVTGTAELVRVSRATYTPAGLLKTLERGWDGTAYTYRTQNDYDAAGNLRITGTTDTLAPDVELGQRSFDYDLLDRLDVVRVHIGPGSYLEARREFDAVGNMTKITNPGGAVYRYEYDRAMQLRAVRDPENAGEAFTYTANGWLDSYRDRSGRLTTYRHDAVGRPIEEWTEGFFRMSRSYDAGDNLASAQEDGDDAFVRFQRDVFGRIDQVEAGARNLPVRVIRYGYDDLHRRTSMTDPEGRSHQYSYSSRGLPDRTSREGTMEAGFGYDAGARRTSQTYGNGAVRRWGYDSSGRPTTMVTRTADGAPVAAFAYEYNAVGQRTAQRMDHLNRRIDYVYDGAARVRSEVHTDMATGAQLYAAAYNYGAAGDRLAKKTPLRHSAYFYSADHQLLEERKHSLELAPAQAAEASDTAAGYTPARVIDGNTADGADPEHAWASLDLPSPHGLTVSVAQSRPLAGVRIWFPQSRLPRRFRIQVGGKTLGQDIYHYAVEGATEVLGEGGIAFQADRRFIEFSFEPEFASAVTFVQEPGGGSPSTPNEAFAVEMTPLAAASSTSVSHSYDGNGNENLRVAGATEQRMEYGPWNRLARYERRVGGLQEQSWEYVHDPLGRRIGRRDLLRGTERQLVYDGDQVISEYVRSGAGGQATLDQTYVNGDSMDARVARFQGSDRAYYVSDHLNSDHRMMGASGSVVSQTVTNVFGEIIAESGEPGRFAGRERDAESGFMNFRARQYDPETGRFLQQDPILGNRPTEHYLYASNDPVNRIDPLGMEAWSTERIDSEGVTAMSVDDLEDTLDDLLVRRKADTANPGFYNKYILSIGGELHRRWGRRGAVRTPSAWTGFREGLQIGHEGFWHGATLGLLPASEWAQSQREFGMARTIGTLTLVTVATVGTLGSGSGTLSVPLTGQRLSTTAAEMSVAFQTNPVVQATVELAAVVGARTIAGEEVSYAEVLPEALPVLMHGVMEHAGSPAWFGRRGFQVHQSRQAFLRKLGREGRREAVQAAQWDPAVPQHVREHISRTGKLPKGWVLAHRHGEEACMGFGYWCATPKTVRENQVDSAIRRLEDRRPPWLSELIVIQRDVDPYVKRWTPRR